MGQGPATYHPIHLIYRPEATRFRTVLVVWLLFFALQVNVALRLPLTGAEIAGLEAFRTQHLPSLVSALANLGEVLVGDPLGQRLPFVIIAAITSILAGLLARRLSDEPLAPAMTILWLNITILFGLGAAQIGNGPIAALFMTLAAYGFCAQQSNGRVWWRLVAGVGLFGAAYQQPVLGLAVIGAVSCAILHAAYRPLLRSSLFWVAVFSPLSIVVLGGHLSVLPRLPDDLFWVSEASGSFLLSVILLCPPIVALAALGLSHSLSPKNEVSLMRLMPAFMAVAVLVGFVASGFKPSVLLPITPILITLGTVAALERIDNFTHWLTDIITPLGLGTYGLLLVLLLHPANALTSKIPVLRDVYGWDLIGKNVEVLANATSLAWAVTETPNEAEKLQPFTDLPVFSTALLDVDCNASGLYIVRIENRDTVMGKFRQFTHLYDVDKRPGGLSSVFLVSGATPILGCGP